MKRSILVLLALFVAAAPAWAAGPNATKAVKAESDGVTTLAVTVSSSEDVYTVTISGAAIDDIRAPKGWVGIASGNHVMFTTDDHPVSNGKSLAFKILTTEPTASLKVAFRGKEDAVGSPLNI